jgi:ABC-type Fe3+/spermidine/putrescine transport system ATPase subunit
MTTEIIAPIDALSTAQLDIENLRKCFGKKRVLDTISLTVAPGRCLALLGPSGSGKSTLLNLIAGFEQPDDGDIRIRGRSILRLPTHHRRIGVVFQQYALFPHLSVTDNVAYPLIRRGISSHERKVRIERLLCTVQLEHLGGQSVQTLSGGQQQRVAIARALAAEPDVLLMDEPMGALDRTLRDQLQMELKVLLREAGATVVYVTHDQNEAMALAESIAVLNDGRIEQFDTAENIYAHPQSAFVARFLWSGANSLTGYVERDDTDTGLWIRFGKYLVLGRWPMRSPTAVVGQTVELVIKPEDLSIFPADQAPTDSIPAQVTGMLFAGSHRTLQLRLQDGVLLTARQPLTAIWRTGDTVHIGWKPDAGRLYLAASQGSP